MSSLEQPAAALLRGSDCVRAPLPRIQIAVFDRVHVPRRRGEIKPREGFDGVFRYAKTARVENAEVGLRWRITLARGAEKPLGGLRRILGETAAVCVHHAK